MRVENAPIAGMKVVHLDVHGDDRGWFKENWQRTKMVEAGLADFGPVQHNVSFNETAGTIRGLHAEPWDKFVSVATGKVFAAWVDLRAGEGFGTTFWIEIDSSVAVFIPRGVANSYQTLTENTTYSYLVNDHWRADAEYVNVNLLDETLAIPWPLDVTAMSEKDQGHPPLAEVQPMSPRRTIVIGAIGQLGLALAPLLPDAEFLTQDQLDLALPDTISAFDWTGVGTVINAAADTDVDGAETTEGRRRAWAINVGGTVALAKQAIRHGFTLVAVSSDYVFDGEEVEHAIDEQGAPLGVYGQTKAACEAVVATVPRHYLVRTSWVVGEGKNFINTMQRLAREGVSPAVVDDQFGRLTPASVLAAGIVDLLEREAPYGTVHITGDGPVMSWWQIARDVFEAEGRDANDVSAVSTEEWAATQLRPTSPRPKYGTLSLTEDGA
ncbi:MAG: sugar nucleotide-binding protein [Actinomycetales bacterium]|nr:sugar nucleotide-binding protein [Actinomycetales bacterium]